MPEQGIVAEAFARKEVMRWELQVLRVWQALPLQ
jgi:hypothetical protein